MAGQSEWTTGENCRHQAALPSQTPMADGVNAPVNGMQAAPFSRSPHRTAPDAEFQELPVRDYAMLPCRNRPDPPVWTTLSTHTVPKFVHMAASPPLQARCLCSARVTTTFGCKVQG
jgi:hypothetical protein